MNTKYLFAMLMIAVFLIGFKVSIADTATGQATIGNTAPSVGTVTLYNQASADAEITLSAGTTVSVFCNASLTDVNGYADISAVTATLYHSTNVSADSDDENSHYTNSSCSIGTNTSATEAPATCTFNLDYMSINGTWTCNMTADDGTATDPAIDTNTLATLVGLDVTNSTVNFGSLELGANSTAATDTHIVNFGNIQMDARFSGDDYTCNVSGTIPVGNTRYNLTTNSYDNMVGKDLTTGATTQTDFDLGVRGLSTADGTNATKSEYWTIKIPASGVAGTCTNTITVAAIAG